MFCFVMTDDDYMGLQLRLKTETRNGIANYKIKIKNVQFHVFPFIL